MPASSPGERVARPAAIISAVLFSTFTAEGSAPSADSVVSNSASAVSAARRKGVAPISFMRVLFRFTFLVIFALMFAPFATSFFTSSRLLIVPEPSGDGSLSPTPGRRTTVMAWSGVYPVRSALGLAPASRRAAARSKCAFITASSSALTPALGNGPPYRRRGPSTGMVSFTSAPAFEQHASDIETALPHGKEQRRETRRHPRTHIRTGGDELLNHGRVALSGGPHQGGLTARLVFGIDARATGQEHFYGRERAGPRRGHQRSLAAR